MRGGVEDALNRRARAFQLNSGRGRDCRFSERHETSSGFAKIAAVIERAAAFRAEHVGGVSASSRRFYVHGHLPPRPAILEADEQDERHDGQQRCTHSTSHRALPLMRMERANRYCHG